MRAPSERRTLERAHYAAFSGLAVVVHGRRGCGKTFNAIRLAMAITPGQDAIDNWAPGDPIWPGRVHLTCTNWENVTPRRRAQLGVYAVSFGALAYELGLEVRAAAGLKPAPAEGAT